MFNERELFLQPLAQVILPQRIHPSLTSSTRSDPPLICPHILKYFHLKIFITIAFASHLYQPPLPSNLQLLEGRVLFLFCFVFSGRHQRLDTWMGGWVMDACLWQLLMAGPPCASLPLNRAFLTLLFYPFFLFLCAPLLYLSSTSGNKRLYLPQEKRAEEIPSDSRCATTEQ